MTSGSEANPPDTAQVDTNGILRPLLEDHAQQSPRVLAWFQLPSDERPRLIVAPSPLSEVVFVLTGPQMKFPRERVLQYLDIVLSMPFEFSERNVVDRTMELYRNVHDDWDDCLVAAYALEYNGGVVFSFDTDFDIIPGITRIEPE